MYNYVPKSQTKPLKKELIELIKSVQNEVRDRFAFQFQFVGSESRNMITWNPENNIGFDFDVNIEVHDAKENYSPKKIKTILMNAFNRYTWQYGYGFCEDSTRVFTIKVKDRANSRILHSCDFAIVYRCADSRQQYIHCRKQNSSPCQSMWGAKQEYLWQYQPKGYYLLPQKIDFCKKNRLWQEVRDLYLDKKKKNTDPQKKSRSIFAETVQEICNKNGFYE